MGEHTSVKLIDSIYSPTEASEVLLTLLNHKIMFLNAQLFEAGERGDGRVIHMEQRLDELKNARAEIIELIQQEINGECLFEISCQIEIRPRNTIAVA